MLKLRDIGRLIKTQDNADTSHPMFLVQERVRTCGFLRWEFVTACFTRKGCEDYIEANGHNLTEPRVYVASSYGNDEFNAVRQFLIYTAMIDGNGD